MMKIFIGRMIANVAARAGRWGTALRGGVGGSAGTDCGC